MISVGTLCIGGPSVMMEIPDAPRLIRVEQMHFAPQGKGGRKPGFGPALVGAVASVIPHPADGENCFFLHMPFAAPPSQPAICKGRVSSWEKWEAENPQALSFAGPRSHLFCRCRTERLWREVLHPLHAWAPWRCEDLTC